MNNMFKKCSSLIFLDISNFNYDNVKDKGYEISDFNKECDIITNDVI
jgi:surface protein